MELWTCSIYDCENMENIVIGVFSTRLKAEEQARVWIEGVMEHQAECYDRKVNTPTFEETIYYRTLLDLGYYYHTVRIECFTLDEMSY